jgi:hypothetical protein
MGDPERNNGSIMRSDLNGKNMITIVPPGRTFTPKQLQLEKRSRKLYWPDREGMRVMRANLDGSEIKTLVDTSLGDSRPGSDERKWCVLVPPECLACNRKALPGCPARCIERGHEVKSGFQECGCPHERVLTHRTRQDEERKLAGSAWRGSGMVFTTRIGTMLDARNMLREYYRLRGQAQLLKIRFHDLRHSAATILKMAGVPDQVIQKLLGHASVRTTQEIYTHLTADAETKAAEKMDEIFRPVAVEVAVKTAKIGVN